MTSSGQGLHNGHQAEFEQMPLRRLQYIIAHHDCDISGKEMNTRWPILLVMSFLMTGCAELNAYLAESNRLEQEREQQTRAAINDGLTQRCMGYGFKPGTDAFANCKQTELNNAVNQVQRQQAIRQATMCKNEWGREVPCSSLPPPPPKNTTTNCRHVGNGNYECNSY